MYIDPSHATAEGWCYFEQYQKKCNFEAFASPPLANTLVAIWAVSIASGSLYTGWWTVNNVWTAYLICFHAEKNPWVWFYTGKHLKKGITNWPWVVTTGPLLPRTFKSKHFFFLISFSVWYWEGVSEWVSEGESERERERERERDSTNVHIHWPTRRHQLYMRSWWRLAYSILFISKAIRHKKHSWHFWYILLHWEDRYGVRNKDKVFSRLLGIFIL